MQNTKRQSLLFAKSSLIVISSRVTQQFFEISATKFHLIKIKKNPLKINMKSQFYEFPYCGSIFASSFFRVSLCCIAGPSEPGLKGMGHPLSQVHDAICTSKTFSTVGPSDFQAFLRSCIAVQMCVKTANCRYPQTRVVQCCTVNGPIK